MRRFKRYLKRGWEEEEETDKREGGEAPREKVGEVNGGKGEEKKLD